MVIRIERKRYARFICLVLQKVIKPDTLSASTLNLVLDLIGKNIAIFRRYKTGYVWQDLLDDDLISPISDNEYVIKGSEITTLSFGKIPFKLNLFLINNSLHL